MGVATAVEFPSDLAASIIGEVVSRKRHLFREYQDIDDDDLKQVALAGCHKAWSKYNCDKAAPQTYLYRIADARIIDLHRSRTRQARNEKRRMDTPAADTVSICSMIDGWAAQAEGEITEDWVKDLVRAVTKIFPTRPRRCRGNPGYKLVTYIGSYAVMQRMKLSTRGMVEYLTARPAIARAIGYGDWIPHSTFFLRCRKVLESHFLPAA